MPKLRPMKLDDLFKLRSIGRCAISPDGARVVFELKRSDVEQNKNYTQLMIADVATGAVEPLTDEQQHNDFYPQWSLDGANLGFISTREKSACVYIMPMTGGEPRRVTDRDGNVQEFRFSPNGKQIVYVYQALNEREKLERDEKQDELKSRPTFKHITRLFHKLDGVGYWNGEYKHVFVTSIRGGGKSKQLTRGAYDHSNVRFSPDGKLVSYISNRSADPDRDFDQSDVFTVKPTGGAAKRITRPPGEVFTHSWSPDGETIAYIGMPNKPGEWWKHDAHLWVVPSKGGKPREITRKLDNDHYNTTIGDVANAGFEAAEPLWTADGDRIYFTVSQQGATEVYSVRANGRDLRQETRDRLDVMRMQRTGKSGLIALCCGSATNPGDLYVVDPDEQFALKRLSDVNGPVLKSIDIVKPEEFWLKSGPTKIHCWVMKPVGFRAGRKYPAILQIHGGPQAQYGQGFYHEMQLMASRGYVVAFCNPRGSSGYGIEHRRCIVGQWGDKDHADVKKLGDWLFSRPYVDKTRVGVTGGSYGGYMTNWIVGHEQRYKAAATQRCVSNFESMFGTSDYGFPLTQEIGGFPWGNKYKQLKKCSPFTFVDKVKTPLLIIHSEEDLRCPLEQSQQMFTALKYLGREVEFVAFEGESHGLSRGGRPANRAERLRRIMGWFDKYLQK